MSNEAGTVSEAASRPGSTSVGTATVTGSLSALSECSVVGSTTASPGPSAPPSMTTTTDAPEHPPPDYATVLVEMNRAVNQPERPDISIVISDESANASDKSDFIRPISHQRTQSSSLTAADVANILRSSVRRVNSAVRHSAGTVSPSSERLVDSAEPMSQQEPASVGVAHSEGNHSHC